MSPKPKRPRHDDPPQPGGHRSQRASPAHHREQRAHNLHAACYSEHAAHPHHPTQPHQPHHTQEESSNREGLRAGTLHSRGTALVLRHEGLARHHLRLASDKIPMGECRIKPLG